MTRTAPTVVNVRRFATFAAPLIAVFTLTPRRLRDDLLWKGCRTC